MALRDINYELYIGALDCSQRLVHFEIETPSNADGIMLLHRNISMALIHSDDLLTLFEDGLGKNETDTLMVFRSQGISFFWKLRYIRVLHIEGRLIHVEL